MWWAYLVAAFFMISGFSFLFGALKRRATQENMLGKNPPLLGKGGKVLMVYVGVVMIVLSIVIIIKLR